MNTGRGSAGQSVRCAQWLECGQSLYVLLHVYTEGRLLAIMAEGLLRVLGSVNVSHSLKRLGVRGS